MATPTRPFADELPYRLIVDNITEEIMQTFVVNSNVRWVKKKIYRGSRVITTYYICAVSTDGLCPMKMKICQEDEKFAIWYSNEHDHSASPARGVSSHLLQLVEHRVQTRPHITPLQLSREIHQFENIEIGRRQAQNLLRKIGNAETRENTIGQIREIVEGPLERYNYTENDVSMTKFILQNSARYQIFFTTKNLLRSLRNSTFVCMDFTHCISKEKLKMGVLCVHDAARRIFPISFLIASCETMVDYQVLFNETRQMYTQSFDFPFPTIKLLMGDGAPGLNGFAIREINAERRLTCWFHVLKGIDVRDFNNPLNKNWIKKQLYVIHQSISTEMFQHAYAQLSHIWGAREDRFIRKFARVYVNSVENCNWYSGARIVHNSRSDIRIVTTNPCESLNSVIKRDLRSSQMNLLNLNTVLRHILEEQIPNMSKEISSKNFVVGNILTSELWEHALLIKTRNVAIPRRTVREFVVINKRTLKIVETAHTNPWLQLTGRLYFDKFENECLVQLATGNWRDARCSCSIFCKNGNCTHSLGLCLFLERDLENGDADSCPRHLIHRINRGN